MMEMCHTRRAVEKKQEQHDLFSSLLDASDEEADGFEEDGKEESEPDAESEGVAPPKGFETSA